MQFAGIVMHDSEDLIHPLELKLFNKLVDIYDFVQLPDYSFSRPIGSLISGLYMDEFAEMHTKDLEVRQRLSGVIPCAGVSACFSREGDRSPDRSKSGRSTFEPHRSLKIMISHFAFQNSDSSPRLLPTR